MVRLQFLAIAPHNLMDQFFLDSALQAISKLVADAFA
jgi:hypothetical protein